MKIRETDLSESQRVREPESPSHHLVKIWPKFGLLFFGQVSPWNIFPSPFLSGQPTPFMHFFSPRYQSIYGHQVWCLTLWSCGPARSGDKLKPLVATTVAMATKICRMVTYLEQLPPIKSHDSLITWSWKIQW